MEQKDLRQQLRGFILNFGAPAVKGALHSVIEDMSGVKSVKVSKKQETELNDALTTLVGGKRGRKADPNSVRQRIMVAVMSHLKKGPADFHTLIQHIATKTGIPSDKVLQNAQSMTGIKRTYNRASGKSVWAID